MKVYLIFFQNFQDLLIVRSILSSITKYLVHFQVTITKYNTLNLTNKKNLIHYLHYKFQCKGRYYGFYLLHKDMKIKITNIKSSSTELHSISKREKEKNYKEFELRSKLDFYHQQLKRSTIPNLILRSNIQHTYLLLAICLQYPLTI